jgi:hypothetical protein
MRDTNIQELYNTFLRISRKKQNKPYKLRTNWEDFESSKQYPTLIKLKNFFDRNFVVNVEDFLTAPYEVYEEEGFYDLDFYNSMTAVKVYNIFCDKKRNLEPDSELQQEAVLRGINFIKKFCILKDITLTEYLSYREPEANINSFVVHLKEKNISIYNLFPFRDFDKIFSSLDFSILRFILNDLASRVSFFRAKFYSSKTTKNIAITGLKIIEQKIQQKTT